jgi:glycine/sarcosine N-methyltransferase
METPQNEFYSSISEYYSEIFPYNPAQLQFVNRIAGGLTGRKILDIGCATGELAFELAAAGAQITGIDLNEDLISKAQRKLSEGDTLCNGFRTASCKFMKVDMLELESSFHPDQFDMVICFGNTLVHLPSYNHIIKMLKGVHTVLKTGAVFLIQMLNYDYILSEMIAELPVIETDNIRFIRRYRFEENSPVIMFQTELHVRKVDKVISNETPLLALQSRKLTELLLYTGFKNISLFSNFKEDPFGGNHFPLVVKCKK